MEEGWGELGIVGQADWEEERGEGREALEVGRVVLDRHHASTGDVLGDTSWVDG